jgi:hypothetical protein
MTSLTQTAQDRAARRAHRATPPIDTLTGYGTVPPRVGKLGVIGHSWANGLGASTPERAFAQRVASMLGATIVKQAHDGAIAVGPASDGGAPSILRNYPAVSRIPALIMLGFNDPAVLGAAPADQLALKGALRAAIAHARSAHVYRIGDAELATSGAWATNTDPEISSSAAGFAYTFAEGAYFELTLPAGYAGEPLAINATLQGAIGGHFALTIDGADHGTMDLNGPGATLERVGKHGIIAHRVTDAPAGASKLRGTWHADTTAAAFGFGGSLDSITIEDHVPVVLPLFPAEPSSSTSKQAAQLSNAANVAVAREFPELEVVTVDLNPAMAPNTGTGAETSDERYWFAPGNFHPNDRGHARNAAVLYGTLRDLCTPPLIASLDT